MKLNPYQEMEGMNKPGRRHGSKNIVNREPREKAEIVFTEIFKTFGDDLSKASPAERLNAAVALASLFLKPNPKQEN